jgi:hypothetical protein
MMRIFFRQISTNTTVSAFLASRLSSPIPPETGTKVKNRESGKIGRGCQKELGAHGFAVGLTRGQGGTF